MKKDKVKIAKTDRAAAGERIVSDPQGWYTGRTADERYEVPVQDADDL